MRSQSRKQRQFDQVQGMINKLKARDNRTCMKEHRQDFLTMVNSNNKQMKTQDKRINQELMDIKRAEITGIFGNTANALEQKVMNEVMRKIEGKKIQAKTDCGLHTTMFERLQKKSFNDVYDKSSVAKHLKKMEIKEIKEIQEEASRNIKEEQKKILKQQLFRIKQKPRIINQQPHPFGTVKKMLISRKEQQYCRQPSQEVSEQQFYEQKTSIRLYDNLRSNLTLSQKMNRNMALNFKSSK